LPKNANGISFLFFHCSPAAALLVEVVLYRTGKDSRPVLRAFVVGIRQAGTCFKVSFDESYAGRPFLALGIVPYFLPAMPTATA